MELNEKQFRMGFNCGYILAKYEPHTLTNLLDSVRAINSYLNGLSTGKQMYELELTDDYSITLHHLRQRNKNQMDRDL